ncbi:MAG: ATP-binding protein, partial [Nitrosomonas sp.]|nr:ATP-binding protein [Nitrosomonas sp.]
QAQKMEAIGQLTGGIAHDFNNILAAVLGYCQLAIRLTEKNPDEKLNKYLCEIKKGGERARELVSQLLSFSRKKGRDTSDHSLTAVAPIISEVTAMLSSIIPSSIEVHENISTETPDIAVDPVQLHQAILNLCINARDAMNGKGELTITVSHENTNMICSSCHHSFHGSYVSIGVKDSGSGIPDSIKDKLFEPFFTTKDIGKGSGMGLAMVHGIVHNHHGHLTVESEENIGTTFKLHFPVKTRTLDQQRVA